MGRFSIDYLRDEIEKLNTAHPGKVELEVEKKVYSSTEELKEQLSSGPFSVSIDDVSFECFYHADKMNTMPPPRETSVRIL